MSTARRPTSDQSSLRAKRPSRLESAVRHVELMVHRAAVLHELDDVSTQLEVLGQRRDELIAQAQGNRQTLTPPETVEDWQTRAVMAVMGRQR